MPLDQKLVKDYLANRNKLKKHFLQERVQKQEMTRGFEKQFAPLLEPTRETAKETKEVKKALTELPPRITKGTYEAMAHLPQEIAASTSKALAHLPEDVARAAQPLPEYQSELKTKPQLFKESARQLIAEDPAGFAREVPGDWDDLLLKPERKPNKNTWRKWVYREITGKKQATGSEWEKFNQQLIEIYGSGIKYYNNPEELLNRLEMLAGSRKAGNTSRELKNEASNILDRLLKDDEIDEDVYKELWDAFN